MGGFGREAAAEFAVGGDASGDEQAFGTIILGCCERGAGEIAGDRGLEAGDEVEGFGVEEGEGRFHRFGVAWLAFGEAGFAQSGGAGFNARFHAMQLDVAADGGLDAAEGEVETGGVGVGEVFAGELGGGVAGGFGLDLGCSEGDGFGVAVDGEGIHPGAAGVGQAEQLGDLVEGLAGGVVEGFSDVAVAPGCGRRACGEVEVGVASADDQGEERGGVREGLLGVHQDGVDVAFEVVDGDQREVGAEGEGLGEGDADEESAGEAGAFGDGYGG